MLPSWVHDCIDEETLMNEDGEFGEFARLNNRAQTEIICTGLSIDYLDGNRGHVALGSSIIHRPEMTISAAYSLYLRLPMTFMM